MKKIFVFFALFGILFSCSDDSNADLILVGTWKLTEALVDPGDGSGVFTPISSEKVIRFFNDGTVTSNGSLCDFSIQSDESSVGTFSLTESIINSSECFDVEGLSINFQLNDDFLIINYPCIEPCQGKYIKVE